MHDIRADEADEADGADGADRADGADETDTRPARRDVPQRDSVAANRRWWDAQAEAYYAEHGEFLGDAALVWGPEGVDEARLRLLGDLAGLRVLEIGAGAAQGARYVQDAGATVVATDLSAGMLARARAVDVARLAHAGPADGSTDADAVAASGGRPVSPASPATEVTGAHRESASGSNPSPQAGRVAVPLVQCDGTVLPFEDASFDLVFTAYGVVPFVADSAALMVECARVVRPGGRFVFSTTHPLRWCLPDEPGDDGLVVRMSYFDRTPYAELRGSQIEYVEHHRTLGDRVREVVAAGLVLDDLVEPVWPEDNLQTWGGWSPLRGALVPGTAIYVCRRPTRPSP